MMHKLDVHYSGWGEDWLLGTLADDGHTLLFVYSQAALERGLELSPIRLKLRSAAYGGFPTFSHRLPGLVADSLPDGWGLMLMDRVFRREGVQHPDPLDRLAFIGERAMGALRFVPPHDLQADEPTRAGAWRLAPAFDLTFSEGPAGQHSLDVCGESDHIARKELLKLARENDVPVRVAEATIELINDTASSFQRRVADYPIRHTTVRRMSSAVTPLR
jgi:hypothetical protein